jgi:hypothetical protein
MGLILPIVMVKYMYLVVISVCCYIMRLLTLNGFMKINWNKENAMRALNQYITVINPLGEVNRKLLAQEILATHLTQHQISSIYSVLVNLKHKYQNKESDRDRISGRTLASILSQELEANHYCQGFCNVAYAFFVPRGKSSLRKVPMFYNPKMLPFLNWCIELASISVHSDEEVLRELIMHEMRQDKKQRVIRLMDKKLYHAHIADTPVYVTKDQLNVLEQVLELDEFIYATKYNTFFQDIVDWFK